ncbi:DUF3429 domain-containing protein [Franzmannia qiaohouensis]|uniref:DUF3429 domain-containing protein n=1 Tax=Franzmannia qiaohouensis TaxID=1329370 RepID=A0ABU1HCR3_9GAMM|nr:DUF3429 domain-containing protein [Halomonas qiaohouensis]MDR5904624.1 DUF3429 domain-containing protein [Halomonas qiaohouensis]
MLLQARLTTRLGAAGLLPFAFTLLMAWVAPAGWQAWAISAFLFYSAVILSFLGGIQWGVAMTLDAPEDAAFASRMLRSMLPSLIAWPALLLPDLAATLILLAGYLLIHAYEGQPASRARLPGWYRSLRRSLTLCVAGGHVLMALRLVIG